MFLCSSGFRATMLCLAALPVSLFGATISFVSGSDPSGLLQWNSVNGLGVANVAITPDGAWDSSGSAQWVSFTNSGTGGTILPNSGTFGALGASPTASFFVAFSLPNPINTGGVTVWADDTAAVYLADNPGSPVLLFGANTGPEAAHCVAGQISCGAGGQAFVGLTGLAAGAHTLRIDVWQLGGSVFGVKYAGEIQSIQSDEPVPEPGTAMYLLGALAVAGGWRYWTRRAR